MSKSRRNSKRTKKVSRKKEEVMSEIFDYALRKKIFDNIELLSPFYNEVFNYALGDGKNIDLDIMKMLIFNNLITVDDIIDNHWYILPWSSRYGHLDIIKHLVSQGLTLKDIRKYRNSILRIAIKYNQINTVKYLMSHGLNINDLTEINALKLAIKYGNRDMYIYILNF